MYYWAPTNFWTFLHSCMASRTYIAFVVCSTFMLTNIPRQCYLTVHLHKRNFKGSTPKSLYVSHAHLGLHRVVISKELKVYVTKLFIQTSLLLKSQIMVLYISFNFWLLKLNHLIFLLKKKKKELLARDSTPYSQKLEDM